MARSVFQIAQIQYPPDLPRPFMIVETVLTSDGMRSRVTSLRFKTYEMAEKRMKGLIAEQEPFIFDFPLGKNLPKAQP